MTRSQLNQGLSGSVSELVIAVCPLCSPFFSFCENLRVLIGAAWTQKVNTHEGRCGGEHCLKEIITKEKNKTLLIL
jgi:hypothetical protein